jgi:hypothetical protein
MKEYYVVFNNKQSGPYSIEELADLHLVADTLVWRNGLSGWKEAGEVDELASLFSKPSAPRSQYKDDDIDKEDEDEEDDDDDYNNALQQYYPYRRQRRRLQKQKVTDSAFFTFIKPCLRFIDTGQIYRKPFSWLYKLIAALNIISPLYILYKGIEIDIFNFPSKLIVGSFLIWVVCVFASWIGFQLWWDRSDRVLETSDENADFPATPVIAHFIQTAGECLGAQVAVIGFFCSLFATIFLSGEEMFFSDDLPALSVTSMFAAPLLGFAVIILSRLLAEQIRALVTIANNTKKTKPRS